MRQSDRNLSTEVSSLLDQAAVLIRRAHGMASMMESGKAITDYLRLEHDIRVCLIDLDLYCADIGVGGTRHE